jgi:mannitol/fructose-specific phosphotransferase system IIA component (Ntr-type)
METWEQFKEDAIRLDIEEKKKEKIFSVLVDALIESGQVEPELPVLEEVIRREEVLSTGVGNGVALPHARLDNFGRVALAFGRPVKPVDVGAVDGQPADLFFMLIADKDDPSLIVRILGRLARLCDDEANREKLRKAKSPRQVVRLIQDFEPAPVETKTST